jgi:D-ribulokinase
MDDERLFAVGLDAGTGGVRALAINLRGRVVAAGRADLPPGSQRNEGVIAEQDPQAWTAAAQAALQNVAAALPARSKIVGIGVDATSGTFLLADAQNRPLGPGIMYNDLRAAAQAPRAAEALRTTLEPYGIQIAAAFALPKILHLAATQPAVFGQCRHIIHHTDWIVGMLSGRYDVTDVSTALKTGVNPETLAWPEPIFRDLGLPREIFPNVVLPGTPIGRLTPTAASTTGLPVGTPVVAGCTDGTAGCLASGAAAIGDVNVTLGTTLVFKALADKPLVDPQGAVYNHRHPAGGFLPGAASSTGGAWIPQQFAAADLDQLAIQAAALLPTRRLAYPLTTTGERFPFAVPTAHGFGLADIPSEAERFAAAMEGTAQIERLGIERLASLGLPVGQTIFATGGATASDTWLRIRAAVMARTYAVPEEPECAVGAAILAAAAFLGHFARAARMLVRIGRRVEPDMRLTAAYDEKFREFKAELHQRGYV